jgi:hypothetical protein
MTGMARAAGEAIAENKATALIRKVINEMPDSSPEEIAQEVARQTPEEDMRKWLEAEVIRMVERETGENT